MTAVRGRAHRRVARGLQPRGRAAHRDRHRAGPASADDARELSRPSCAGSLRSRSRQRRQHGGGQPALRRQRLGPGDRAAPFGTRVEIKNLNSFRHVRRRIEFEIDRHVRGARAGRADRARRRASGTRQGRTTVDADARKRPTTTATSPSRTSPPLSSTRRGSRDSAASMPELPEARRAPVRCATTASPTTTPASSRVDAARRLLRARRRGEPQRQAARNWVMGESPRDEGATGSPRIALRFPLPPSARRADRARRRRHHHRASPRTSSRRCSDSPAAAAAIVDAEGLAGSTTRARSMRRCARSSPATPRPWRSYRARQDEDVRLPRRPGDEGDRRQRRSGEGERERCERFLGTPREP